MDVKDDKNITFESLNAYKDDDQLQTVTVEIVDTSYNQQFQSIMDELYRTGQIFLLMYDMTSQDSFNHVKDYYNKLIKFRKDYAQQSFFGYNCCH